MERKHNVLMFVSFLCYYVILFVERAYSIISSLTDDSIKFTRMFLKGGIYNKYVYGLTIFCMFVSLIFALRILGKVLANGVGATSKLLIINSGILLVSGMLDTPHSILPVQFVAYIFLFIGCLTKFIEIKNKKEATASTIASFIYFIAFAMAIPLVHKTDCLDPTGRKFYYVFEALASGGLVVTFTILMLFVFSEERYRHVNNVIFFIIMLAANAVVFIQGMAIKDPNYFPVIAAGVAAVAYLVTVLLLLRDKRAKIIY